ncbi:hypothetical protein [Variovorax sp. OV329]|uniref:hypothetical protein n=1 Tax=Variovorax sp. OV329 TaxID=1882825 RepID=UPI000B814E53|nr:hypothetical protein [Variovorax sp. OV329]
MSQQQSFADELADIVERIKVIETQFRRTRDSISLTTEDETTFRMLITDALSIYELAFGKGSKFGRDLAEWVNSYSGGMSGGPSLYAVQGSHKLIEAAKRQMLRLQAISPPAAAPPNPPLRPPYVDPTRLNELRALPKGAWDLTRFVRMLEELNDAYERGNFQTVPMLVRAIKDHVPPIFGEANFAGVFNSSTKSIKGNLEHLENSLKHIADGQLHMQIRRSEVLPTEGQVDFRRDLDVLLAEIVRRLKP